MKQNSLPSLLLGSRTGSADPDADLLTRFVVDRDQTAFAELVHRYARLVWRVARTRCRNDATAEDVFQAAFVVLSRKGSSIRSGDALAGWLHRTAHRLAVKATRKERPVHPLPAQLSTFADPLDALSARELLAAVDDELAKLSDAERSVLVLCGIDRLANDEAAKWLGTSTGSVKGRLERARAKLRIRLDARGLVLPTLVLGLIGNIPPASAVQAALKIPCIGPVSYAIEQLLSEGLTMKLTITKAGAMLALCAVIATVGGWSGEVASQPKVNAAPVPREVRKLTEAWGEERNGLRAGLRMPSGTTVAPGAAEELQVAVRNVSKESITVNYTSQGLGIYAGGVIEKGTVALNWLCYINGHLPLPQKVSLEPGEEFVRWKTLVRHNPMGNKLDTEISRIDLPAGNYEFGMKNIGGELFDTPQILGINGQQILGVPLELVFPSRSIKIIDGLATGTLEVTLPEAKPIKIRAPVPRLTTKPLWSEPTRVDWKSSGAERINGVWAPDGKSVVVPTPTMNEKARPIPGGGVDFLDAMTGKVTHSRKMEPSDTITFQATSIATSVDGKQIIAEGKNHNIDSKTVAIESICVWRDADDSPKFLKGPQNSPFDAFSGVVISPDGTRVTTSTPSGLAYVHELSTLNLLGSSEMHSAKGTLRSAPAYHPSGNYTVIATTAGEVYLNANGDKPNPDPRKDPKYGRLDGCDSKFRAVAVSPDGKVVAAGGASGTKGQLLAVIDDCNENALGKEFKAIVAALPLNEQINGLAFSADSKHLAAACSDGVLRIFDVKTGKLSASVKEHQEEIFSVAYSPDGKKLLTVGRDAMKMWDVARLMAGQ